MNDKFNFSGLPSNDPIEVKKSKNNKFGISQTDGMEFLKDISSGNFTLDKLKGMIPDKLLDELQEELQAEVEAGGTDINDLFSNLFMETLNNLTSLLPKDVLNNLKKEASLEGINIEDLLALSESPDGDTDEEEDDNEEVTYVYELSDIKYLGKQLLGDVPAKNVGASKLLSDFENIFGNSGCNFPNVIESVLNNSACMTDTGYAALISFKDNFGEITVRESADDFLLLYISPKNQDEYGIYFAFSEDIDGNPCISVPIFANTFNVNSNGEFLGLYNRNIEAPFFNGTKFLPEKRAAIDLSVRSQLVNLKNILLSPAQFGTIKNIIPAITSDSRYLKIGKIISNESTEAILLKKDADLDLNEKEFPFYLDFGHTISKESLQILSSILFKINLNETLLMHASELEFKNNMLYIKVDFGRFE